MPDLHVGGAGDVLHPLPGERFPDRRPFRARGHDDVLDAEIADRLDHRLAAVQVVLHRRVSRSVRPASCPAGANAVNASGDSERWRSSDCSRHVREGRPLVRSVSRLVAPQLAATLLDYIADFRPSKSPCTSFASCSANRALISSRPIPRSRMVWTSLGNSSRRNSSFIAATARSTARSLHEVAATSPVGDESSFDKGLVAFCDGVRIDSEIHRQFPNGRNSLPSAPFAAQGSARAPDRQSGDRCPWAR